MNIFIIYKNKKQLAKIEAKDLKEAEKIANKKYPQWTDLYESR